ncbi:MAG: hypothetical protein K6F15_03050 [Treponema sp.]|nr:hypothetical protein [Treponema sp.]
MKKSCACFIVAFFLLSSAKSFSESGHVLKKILIRNDLALNLEQEEIEKSSLADTADFTLYLKGLTFKSAWKYSPWEFDQRPDFNRPAFALSFNVKEVTKFPFILTLGQISCGGSLSLFSSPSLPSSLSPLAKLSPRITSLGASMPSASSYDRVPGFYLKLESPEIRIPFCKSIILKQAQLSSFYDLDQKFALSGLASINFLSDLHFSISYTAANLPISSENSSWISEEIYFPQNFYLFQNLQSSFSSRHFITKESLNIYQSAINPYSKNEYSFSSENSLSIKDFTLNFSAFLASSRHIYNSSGRRLNTLAQFKINPQLLIYSATNTARFRFGLILLSEEKIAENDTSLVKLKGAFRSEFRTKKVDTSIMFSLSDMKLGESFYKIINEGIPYTMSQSLDEGIFTVSSTHSLYSLFCPKLKLSYSYSKENKKSLYKAAFNFKINNFYTKADFYLNAKEEQIQKSYIEIQTTYKIPKKKLLFTAAFGIKYNFL